MNTIVSRALWGTLLAGGITLLGATVAQAAETTGDDGLLSGTQALVSLDAPITIGGNAVSLLGDATSTDAETSTPDATSAPSGSASTSGLDGILSGDPLLSVRGDVAEECWRILTPVLDSWASGEVPLDEYTAGSYGPTAWN